MSSLPFTIFRLALLSSANWPVFRDNLISQFQLAAVFRSPVLQGIANICQQQQLNCRDFLPVTSDAYPGHVPSNDTLRERSPIPTRRIGMCKT